MAHQLQGSRCGLRRPVLAMLKACTSTHKSVVGNVVGCCFVPPRYQDKPYKPEGLQVRFSLIQVRTSYLASSTMKK
jgi:hypothetical protein